MAISAISAINPAAFVPLIQSLAQATAAQQAQPAQTQSASTLQPAVTPPAPLTIQQEILSALEQTLLGNLFSSPFGQPTPVNPAVQDTLLTTFQLNALFANGSSAFGQSNTAATPGLNLTALFTSLNQINTTGTLLNTLA